MASTYSSLKIQLMGTGENSGTWGTVTNVNLGTALEEAIVGSADVTFSSGNVTLTLTDSNSSQAARNLRLNCTGTTGGARDLVVPAIEKVYIVNNGCADAITVKNSSGTGIAVPAGKTMWVYNTGSNVVDAVTHLSSLTLTTVLPTSSGGTGTNLTTFCNLQSNVSGVLPNANTTAASANGASTIVARDASGNFSANTITANVTGNVSGSAATLTTARNFQISGGATAANVSFNGSAAVDLNVTALNASVINAGTVPTARLGSGTANNTTFLRGDQTFAAVDVGVTSLNGQTGAITNTGYGAIGSYFIGVDASIPAFQAGGGTYSPGGTVAGSNLNYPTQTGNAMEIDSTDTYASAGLSGTWRRMTYYVLQDRTDLPAWRPIFMFVRVS